MRTSLILAAPVTLLSLAACGDNKSDPEQGERGSAAGEVLGGTVSDAMIPLDSLRSTSPIDGAAAQQDGAAPENDGSAGDTASDMTQDTPTPSTGETSSADEGR